MDSQARRVLLCWRRVSPVSSMCSTRQASAVTIASASRGDVLADALVDADAEADVPRWVAGEVEGVGVGVVGRGPVPRVRLAAPRNMRIFLPSGTTWSPTR